MKTTEERFTGPLRNALSGLIYYVVTSWNHGQLHHAEYSVRFKAFLTQYGVPLEAVEAICEDLFSNPNIKYIEIFHDWLKDDRAEAYFPTLIVAFCRWLDLKDLSDDDLRRATLPFTARDQEEKRSVQSFITSLRRDYSWNGKKLVEGRAAVSGYYEVDGTFYRIEERLNGGGNGSVYRAFRGGVGQACAVKVFDPSPYRNDAENRTRFRKEFLWLKAANSKLLVRVFDLGLVEDFPAYSMELLAGDLSSAKGKLTPEKKHQAIGDIARALQLAHSQEPPIVHRDVKPGNILLDQDGAARLSDWGIARIDIEEVPEQWRDLTDDLAAQLAPKNYASPEQMMHQPAGPLSDVFMLGVVAYELLTGKRPRPVPPARGASKLEAGLDAFLVRMLAVEVDLRPSASEVASFFDAEVKKLSMK